MIEILGDSIIKGEIEVSGSKNASLPIICASLLTRGIVELKNVPNILDITILYDILKKLNVQVVVHKNKTIIDASNIIYADLTGNEERQIRGSSYLLSVMLFLFKKIKIAYPGGCSLGQRGLNYHTDSCRQLGVNVVENNIIEASYTKLKGGNIGFDQKSVGATINTIILAGASKQVVRIYNASIEPEVKHTIAFLRLIGYKIFEFKDYILVAGHSKIKKRYKYTIPYDRIEAQSYILLGTKSEGLKIKNVNVAEMESLFRLFDATGQKYKISGNEVSISQNKTEGTRAIALPYPALATDVGPLLVPFMLSCSTKSYLEDRVYPTRFNYIEGLKIMRANIKIYETYLEIEPSILEGSVVKGYDLRGVFSLIIAASTAKGRSVILDGKLALRGYENLIEKLNNIGIHAKLI